MKKIILGSLIMATIFSSCKKDSPAPAAVAVFTYSAWTDCSPAGVQTRTYTSSITGSLPPADSISRSCTYVAPSVIFNFGPWTGDCATQGVQRRSVLSTIPADSFNIAYPSVDSLIRLCPGVEASFPGSYKITADTLFSKAAGATTYSFDIDAYADTSWNPAESLNDTYIFNANGSFSYNDGGTPLIPGNGTNFLSYPYLGGAFATGWNIQSGFLHYTPEATFGAWGYFRTIISTKFVLNYSFTSGGTSYIQSTTYTKQ